MPDLCLIASIASINSVWYQFREGISHPLPIICFKHACDGGQSHRRLHILNFVKFLMFMSSQAKIAVQDILSTFAHLYIRECIFIYYMALKNPAF